MAKIPHRPTLSAPEVLSSLMVDGFRLVATPLLTSLTPRSAMDSRLCTLISLPNPSLDCVAAFMTWLENALFPSPIS